MTTTINIGILAHVDAGKTSLTERLLHDAGAIDRLGSVDSGDTRTDTGRIERERGITVRTAVAPFRIGDTRVNLIDTPGHGDFVAEVERALSVLDGAVLVLSAVEGVQAHTRLLMRVLSEMRLPVLLFVNKVDRGGADPERVFAQIRRRLTGRALALDTVRDPGTPGARVLPFTWDAPDLAARACELLAEEDDALLAALVDDRPPPLGAALRGRVRDQVGRGLLYPVLSGSAMTGVGVPELSAALTELLTATEERGSEEACGTVFAIERSASGEKTGYLRLHSGVLRARDRVLFARADPEDGDPHQGRVTHLEVVGAEGERGRALTAGGIGRIRGLPGLRVGDRLGASAAPVSLVRPALESIVRPADEGGEHRLHAALSALSDQDPLIRLRTVPGEGLSVLLHGEVQKEVVADTLATEFGVEAVFEPSSVVHTEHPTGTGTAVEEIDFERELAGPIAVGLRVEPGEEGSGVVFRRETELGALLAAQDRAVEETVRDSLGQGLYGWPVTDCVVTLVHSGYVPPVPVTLFRLLTPVVLMRALDAAGTRVHEPVHAFEADVPEDVLGAAVSHLHGCGARVADTDRTAEGWRITGDIPVRGVDAFLARLPGLTRGEGVWWTRPAGDHPVRGSTPRRARTDGNPLNLASYLVHLGNAGRAGISG
ncbi:TetM/TetW/TetO/TetS family tetracycline resistance ribosomal protection protein [Nocardiopsis exhalans]|uniref:TetM/TetW/TetO/TetS family tetracycline resistance ribosomal protection protein n=1 Tax=Nocardiopsis exhalans TaxID=163604 RepID=A0ABY5D7I6_9ACTN|nr:TetM/TetW/TetO/TetS family tetracycline resistance ribosomal protection protein [Nocardiopsis exhalans]USY19345.1 TetM/TetW/TetO/TetS family tetracycline resistance ribosomal protection protein [Nocardiopsis exhalans]